MIASFSRPQTFDSAKQPLYAPSTTSTMSDARTPSPRLADLTGREVEVLRLIANGATNREIVEQLVMYVLVPYPQYYTLAFCKQHMV